MRYIQPAPAMCFLSPQTNLSHETIVKENGALPEPVNSIATQRPQKEDPFPIQGGSTAR